LDDIDQQARERVGTVLQEKWTLERMLGIGGMAAVYEGRHRNGARAAIKVLHPSLSRHAEVRERFLREGYAANKVEHPGAVKVLDDDVIGSGPDAGTAYIVMELLEGESLQDRLERGPPLTESEFLAIAAEVLEVLDAAHTRGVVHRDLKPENLFLVSSRDPGAPSARPRVKVLDFGLARLLDGQTITSHGLALGTPSFMSPEQAAGRIDEIDGRTDLFALGATGFRVRTGRRVQEGAGPVELVAKMANFAAPRIRALSPEVSEPFARVVDRALEFKREDRYPDAASMRDDVRRAITELDGQARTIFALEAPSPVPVSIRPAPPTPAPAASPPSPAPPPRPPSPPATPSEPTMEVSGGDLAPPSTASPAEPPLPVITSVPHRRRRSLLPWITLLVLGGIAGKLYWDQCSATEVPPAAPVASTPLLSPPPPTAIGVPSASTPAANPAVAALPTSTATLPAPRGAAAAPHLHSPTKVGPGNVHVLSPKYRKH
jgi:serine/threonine-protein kinase